MTIIKTENNKDGVTVYTVCKDMTDEQADNKLRNY
jgi:hypothetical protein